MCGIIKRNESKMPAVSRVHRFVPLVERKKLCSGNVMYRDTIEAERNARASNRSEYGSHRGIASYV